MVTSVWPDGFDAPIADVVSMAAHIELSLEELVSTGLWQTPSIATFVLRNLATEKLVSLAELIVLEALPDKKALAKSVFAGVRQGRQQRNMFLHRVWNAEPDGSQVKMKSRPGRDEEQSRNLADIERLAGELAEAVIGLTLLRADLSLVVARERQQSQFARRKG